MANEFKHKDAGTSLTRAEDNAIDRHEADSQASGDILYCDGTYWLRLAKGTAGDYLKSGTPPAWEAHSAVTTGIHGVGAGAIVGTTLSQTLTNKTLTSPTINGTIATTGLTMPAFTLGGTLSSNGQDVDMGAGSLEFLTTQVAGGLKIKSTNDGGIGVYITAEYVSTSPTVGDWLATLLVYGRNDNSPQDTVLYHYMRVLITDPSHGSEDARMDWILQAAGGTNLAMILEGTGVLSVDASGVGAAAQVDEFDRYDDAAILRQVFTQKNLERLVDIGVADYKTTGSGYMLKTQKWNALVAGGIYQTRALLEALARRLGIDPQSLLTEALRLPAGHVEV